METTHRLSIRMMTCLLAAGLLSALQPVAAESEHASADAVLDRHLQAFAADDVDAIMADYDDQAVFITPTGVLEGKPQIRALFETLVAEFSSPDATITVHQRYSHGPIAYIVWSADTPAHRYELATDTLYVVDNRIRYQTFAAKSIAK
ncbi:nuclear transport factor 2 family protein [Marinobacter caseinilyticus]|uniref:nuclear transport factor 2 family protein n=1 Tax=Marinobacter caseinilyticus TaxID=2692195 RepID=UPI001A93C52D|nr:nuclear transport factor 2 family protein [Marinobacter caseinilyticus]